MISSILMSTLKNTMPQPISNIIPPNILRGGRANTTVVTVCPASLHCCVGEIVSSKIFCFVMRIMKAGWWRELVLGWHEIFCFSHITQTSRLHRAHPVLVLWISIQVPNTTETNSRPYRGLPNFLVHIKLYYKLWRRLALPEKSWCPVF